MFRRISKYKFMKRRDSLKALLLSSAGVAAAPLIGKSENNFTTDVPKKEKEKPNSWRTDAENAHESQLQSETFFTKDEMRTIAVLCDIIVPADSVSGSATQAGVPAFIEFTAKDQPDYQTPLRGGLRWLDVQCMKLYGNKFADCTITQRLAMCDEIAYPEKVKPAFRNGVPFFNKMRDLTLTGFYTSEIGIKDIGYVGNVPNNWEGVPADELRKQGVSY